MRIAGGTDSNKSSTVSRTAFLAPSAQPSGATSFNSATNPSFFAYGNGYFVRAGASTSTATDLYVSYSTSLTAASWSTFQISATVAARGVTYIDTGSNKYWVYGNAGNGTFSYTSDGTPFGTLSTVTPQATNATSSTYMTYCPGANRPFVAVGGHSTTGIYVATATSIAGPWSTATGVSESVGNSSVQGIAWGRTGTGDDQRLIFVVGGNAAGSTYFSAANDTTSYTKQTVTGGDCRGLAYTGTHWLYLGDNQFGRAPTSSFSATTGNSITYSIPTGYPGTVRGLWAAPSQSGIAYLSGGAADIHYSTDHGATWTATGVVTSAVAVASQAKMYMSEKYAICYSGSGNAISYIDYT